LDAEITTATTISHDTYRPIVVLSASIARLIASSAFKSRLHPLGRDCMLDLHVWHVPVAGGKASAPFQREIASSIGKSAN